MPRPNAARSAEIIRPDWHPERRRPPDPESIPREAEIIQPDWRPRDPAAPPSARLPIILLFLYVAIIVSLAGAAHAQPGESVPATNAKTEEGPGAAPAQDPERWSSVKGTVKDIFGNKFVLEAGSERLLVTTGPDWYHRLDVRVGEEVTIRGERGDDGFDAFRIVRGDGSETEIRPFDAPPAWAGQQNPSGAGKGRFKKRDGQSAGRGDDDDEDDGPPAWAGQQDPTGEGKGRFKKRGDQDQRRAGDDNDGDGLPSWTASRKGPPWRGDEKDLKISEGVFARLVKNAGYDYLGDIEQRDRHVELVARNREGEVVELRIDSDGNIVRERRLRDRQ